MFFKFITIASIAALTLISYLEYTALKGLTAIAQNQQARIELFESGIQKSNEVILDITRGQVNSVQDSVEERIGTLEREMEDVKFLLGQKSK